jgi:hypothetical protein
VKTAFETQNSLGKIRFSSLMGAMGVGTRTKASAVPSGSLPKPLAVTGPHVSPTQWLHFDKHYMIPVVDSVSRHLYVACTALGGQDYGRAEVEMRALAAELTRYAVAASKANAASVRAEVRLAQHSSWRLASSAAKVGAAAQAIANGKIRTKDQLEAVIDESTCMDLDCRWLFVDEIVRFSLSLEPQRHFAATKAALARKDYNSARTEILKAISYLRLESARAIGGAKLALESAIAGLVPFAAPDSWRSIDWEQALADHCASANLALGVVHRRWGSESWIRGDLEAARCEFKAAADSFVSLACWVEGEIQAATCKAAHEALTIGQALSFERQLEREKIGHHVESLGRTVEALGLMIDLHRSAASTKFRGSAFLSRRGMEPQRPGE